jgi:hypothetical protein
MYSGRSLLARPSGKPRADDTQRRCWNGRKSRRRSARQASPTGAVDNGWDLRFPVRHNRRSWAFATSHLANRFSIAAPSRRASLHVAAEQTRVGADCERGRVTTVTTLAQRRDFVTRGRPTRCQPMCYAAAPTSSLNCARRNTYWGCGDLSPYALLGRFLPRLRPLLGAASFLLGSD